MGESGVCIISLVEHITYRIRTVEQFAYIISQLEVTYIINLPNWIIWVRNTE